MGLGAGGPALRWKALQKISELLNVIMEKENVLAFLERGGLAILLQDWLTVLSEFDRATLTSIYVRP
jgi:hypothetical protein